MTKARDAADKAPVALTEIKTVNSTSLVGSGNVAVQPTLVSGTNIKTINGSSVLGSGDLAVGGGSMILLSTVTASNSATVNVENAFDDTYDEYLIRATNVVHVTDGQRLVCRLKIGGAYKADAFYRFRSVYAASGELASNAVQQIAVTGVSASSSSQRPLDFDMLIANPESTASNKGIRWFGGMMGASADGWVISGFGCYYNSTDALTGVRFFAESGNIISGTFRLYGIKKS